jgi:hypothetical protein
MDFPWIFHYQLGFLKGTQLIHSYSNLLWSDLWNLGAPIKWAKLWCQTSFSLIESWPHTITIYFNEHRLHTLSAAGTRHISRATDDLRRGTGKVGQDGVNRLGMWD